MANKYWLGRAYKTRQVTTITVTGPVVAGEEWTVTINGKDITYVATGTTTGNVTAGLVALLTDTNAPAEFVEADWTDDDPAVTMTATADFGGVPITVTSSTDSAGGTLVTVTTTAATGPWHADNVNNWSGGSLPANGDSVYFGPAEFGPAYGLTALAAVTPALIEISSLATYDIGNPRINAEGGYTEYRALNMQFAGVTLLRMPAGDGAGSALIRFDFGSAVFAGQINQTGTSSETGAPAVNIIGTHADNSIEVNGGTVGIASFLGEVSTLKTSVQAGGTLTTGYGVTLNGAGSTITIGEGAMKAHTAIATATVQAGTLTLEGTGAATSITIHPAATCYYNSSGTCTAVVVSGTLDCTADRSSRTFTTLTLNLTGVLNGRKNFVITNMAFGADVDTVVAS